MSKRGKLQPKPGRCRSSFGRPSAGFLVQVPDRADLLAAPRRLLVPLVGALPLAGSTAEEPPVETTARRACDAASGRLRVRPQGDRYRPELLCVATINFFNFVFHAIFDLYATRSSA